MAVPKSKDPAIVVAGFLGVDFHESKIPHSIVGQAVGLGADAQTGGFEGFLDRGDELVMGDGTPGGGWIGRRNFADFLQIDVMSAAVKDEVRCSTLDLDGGLRCEICNHRTISGFSDFSDVVLEVLKILLIYRSLGEDECRRTSQMASEASVG